MDDSIRFIASRTGPGTSTSSPGPQTPTSSSTPSSSSSQAASSSSQSSSTTPQKSHHHKSSSQITFSPSPSGIDNTGTFLGDRASMGSFTQVGDVAVSKSEMLRQLVRNLVVAESGIAHNSAKGSGHAFTVEQHNHSMLQKYFDRNRDLVYTEIIRRAEMEYESIFIVVKCVQLIKNNLRKNMPSVFGLIRIDRFCRSIQQSNGNNALLNRTLQFARDLIRELVYTKALPEEREQWEQYDSENVDNHDHDEYNTATGDRRKVLQEVGDEVTKTMARKQQTTATSLVSSLAKKRAHQSPRHHHHHHHHHHIRQVLITNMYQWRCITSQIYGIRSVDDAPASLESKNRTLLDSIYFGGQFRKVTKFEDKQPEIDTSSCIRLDHVRKLEQHIETVRRIKREQNEEKKQKLTEENTSDPTFVHPLPLFEVHEAHLADQEPMTIEPESLQKIFDNALDPSDEVENLHALSTVTKLFYDVFVSGNVAAIAQTESFFFEMIGSPYSRTRKNAFQLLYNLHYALRTDALGNEHKLFDFLCDMAMQLCFNNETVDSVWNASQACFTNFVTDPHSEKMDMQLVERYDLRVIAKYLSILKATMQDEHQHTQMVAILTNHLYTPTVAGQFALNLDKLRQIGGISFIIDHYLHTRSLQAKQNLFCIIFDYILRSMEQRKKIRIDKGQEDILFEMLHRGDAALYLVQIFKFVPDRFLEHFTRFLFLDMLVRQKTLSQFKANVDQFMIISFVYELRDLAIDYLKMEQEFMIECSETLVSTLTRSKSSNTKRKRLVSLVRSLLESSDEGERRNGEAMLFSIIKCIEEYSNKKEVVVLRSEVEKIMDSLCHSENEHCRVIYLSVTEKVLFFYRSKFHGHGDDRIRFCLKYLNENLLKFASAKEAHVRLLLKMFYLIMDFISIYNLPCKDNASNSSSLPLASTPHFANMVWSDTMSFDEENNGMAPASKVYVMDETRLQQLMQEHPQMFRVSQNDNIFQMFLSGRLFVAEHLLRDINISILHFLFTYLSLAATEMSSHAEKSMHNIVENARVILLNFIIEKCRTSPSVLDSIGGMSFFRVLLNDSNPAVALFAAGYLMKQLSLSAPTQYFAYLNQLIFKAQMQNNPELLENPYMLLKTLANQQQTLQ